MAVPTAEEVGWTATAAAARAAASSASSASVGRAAAMAAAAAATVVGAGGERPQREAESPQQERRTLLRDPTRGIEPRTPTAGCCRGGPPHCSITSLVTRLVMSELLVTITSFVMPV